MTVEVLNPEALQSSNLLASEPIESFIDLTDAIMDMAVRESSKNKKRADYLEEIALKAIEMAGLHGEHRALDALGSFVLDVGTTLANAGHQPAAQQAFSNL